MGSVGEDIITEFALPFLLPANRETLRHPNSYTRSLRFRRPSIAAPINFLAG